MRVVTWNVNSLKARRERVEPWIDEVQPDVLCIQETKMADDAFPALMFSERGYESVHFGQGRWNGVAIISKVGLADVTTNFADGIEPDPDARIVSATCNGVRIVNCYVPNGRALDDDHYVYKLSWLQRLRSHIDAESTPTDDVIVLGDFNIAPEDRDVHDPAKLAMTTHTSDAERQRLSELCDWGLTDLFRVQHPDADRVFSWWDYRGGDFHQGRGMRIDLILGTKSVADRLDWCVIDRNSRKGKSPSDHAPVIADL